MFIGVEPFGVLLFSLCCCLVGSVVFSVVGYALLLGWAEFVAIVNMLCLKGLVSFGLLVGWGCLLFIWVCGAAIALGCGW